MTGERVEWPRPSRLGAGDRSGATSAAQHCLRLACRVGNDIAATPLPVRLTDLHIEAVLFAIKSFVLAWLLGDSRAAACAAKFHSFPLK
jgi:hypothetical protein